MDALETQLGVRFRNRALLEEALTHRSFSNEQSTPGVPDNERLEFLGDAVLELIVSDQLMTACPAFDEGDLSRSRASLVRASNLVRYAERLGIGRHLRLGQGEELSGGRGKPALLVDALEAVIGALYLDRGLEAARSVVSGLITGDVSAILSKGAGTVDSKSLLQERVHRLSGEMVRYVVVGETGPDHRKSFSVEARAGDARLAEGAGRSRKAAEQAAARHALEILDGGRSRRQGSGPDEET